ncbi:hypothetical protein D3C87_2174310 [compost metagenome]
MLDIQECRAADCIITLNAHALVDLFAAHRAIETARAKQAEKLRRRAIAAAAAKQPEIHDDPDDTA